MMPNTPEVSPLFWAQWYVPESEVGGVIVSWMPPDWSVSRELWRSAEKAREENGGVRW